LGLENDLDDGGTRSSEKKIGWGVGPSESDIGEMGLLQKILPL